MGRFFGLGLVWGFLFSLSAWCSCLSEFSQQKYEQKTWGDYFRAKEATLAGESAVSFQLREEIHLGAKEEEELYYEALSDFDDLLEKGSCPSSLRRVYFHFAKTSMAISTKDLGRIRELKDRPEWRAHALARSQVSHEKN